jgi:hypothetical protein
MGWISRAVVGWLGLLQLLGGEKTTNAFVVVGPLSARWSMIRDSRSGGATRGKIATRTARRTRSGSRLYGILDEVNSDAYVLSSSTKTGSGGEAATADRFEIFLADLVFSTNDPRVDIVNKFDIAASDEFTEWLDQKINSSRDPEERIALKDLAEIIVDVKTRVEVNKLAEERTAKEQAARDEAAAADMGATSSGEEAAGGDNVSTADILKKALQIQTASNGQAKVEKEKVTFYETELTPEIRLSYEQLLKKVMPPYKAGDTAQTIALKFYDQFDAQFVKLLNERAVLGDNDAQAVLEALAVEQQKHIAAATASLKNVLSLGDPMRMEGAIVKMAREGNVDEAFLLLLEANEQQAMSAGAAGPARLMQKLRKRAIDEKDKQASSKEIALLRKLLRTDDANEREKLLEDAFTPRDALIVAGTAENAKKAFDGQAPDQNKPLPDVPPPDFINACKAVLINFGNLGSDDENRGDLASRIKKLAAEAEVVATRIFGKGMTTREQQDQMWEQQTTSIFDLETMELEAERNGEMAPWANAETAGDDMLIPGFDKNGRMQIGGT